MGAISFTVGRLNPTARYTGGGGVFATTIRTSDVHTSSTTASYVENASGDITLAVGEYIRIHTDTACWVRFDGVATVGDGFLLPADTFLEWECDTGGQLVSVIDLA